MKITLKKLNAAFVSGLIRLSGLGLKAEYITSAPSAQNALDLFKGEWASKLPPPFEHLVAGEAALFDDNRMKWMAEQLADMRGMSILECGPLEGGHTYMLKQFGVESILSIEASTRAYLKCLVLKELLGLHGSHFVLGDFVSYLRDSKRFDLVVACGVLYHLVNPIEAIAYISKATDQVYIWTHYYDRKMIESQRVLSHRFQSSKQSEFGGFKHTLYRQHYQTRLGNPGFMGGSAEYSNWISRDDLTGALEFFGFNEITVQFDQSNGPAGPSISLLARRRT
jgi:hypothetical protein